MIRVGVWHCLTFYPWSLLLRSWEPGIRPGREHGKQVLGFPPNPPSDRIPLHSSNWASRSTYRLMSYKFVSVISRFTAKSFFRLLSTTFLILPIISITPFSNIFQFQILPHFFWIIPILLILFNFTSLIFYLPYASHLWCSTFPHAPQFPLGNLVPKALSHFILLLPLLLALV